MSSRSWIWAAAIAAVVLMATSALPTPCLAQSCLGVGVNSSSSLVYAVLQGGSVVGWGYNDAQVLGPGIPDGAEVVFPVPLGLERIVSVSTRGLALRDDGRVMAWGKDPLGTGVPGDSLVPAEVLGLDDVVKVLGGWSTKWALRRDGTVWAWGTLTQCGFGDPLVTRSEVPIPLPGLSGVVDISGGGGGIFAVLADGTVLSWGMNWNGELGRGTVGQLDCAMLPIPGLVDVVAVEGRTSPFFLKRDGTVWACGSNWDGTLGDGTEIDRAAPVQVVGLDGIVKVRGAFRGGRAIRSDGTLWAWGWNDEDQIGIGPGREKVLAPRQVPVSAPVMDATASSWHSTIVLADGTVQAVGYGAEPWNDYPAPAPILGPGATRMLAARAVVRGDGSLWTWGHNRWGAVGDGTNFERPSPVEVIASGVRVFSKGGSGYQEFSAALKDDGTVWTWGRNESGQLGNGTLVDSWVPVAVPALTGVQDIALGWKHGLALTAAGTIVAWGANGSGQLGNNSTTDSSVPVAVSDLSGVVEIAAGDSVSMARLADGTVWAWGDNSDGQTGLSPGGFSRRPVMLAAIADAVAIRVMGSTSVALTADRQVWTWGRSGRDAAPTHLPAPLPEASDPARLGESGGGPAAVILRDGRVLGWGRNVDRLIDGSPAAPRWVDLAVEMPELHGAAIVAFGDRTGHAVFPDGSVWGWGMNQYGDVGNGRMVKALRYVDFLVGTDVIPTASEGNVVRAVRVGNDVRLSYGGSAALLRRVFRDSDKTAIATTRLPPDTSGVSFDDRGAIGGPETWYYAVKALSPCSHSEGP